MEWQPIETAPKDGTIVDLWMVDEKGEAFREANAYWVSDKPVDKYDYGSREVRSGWFAPNHDYDGEDDWADEPPWTDREGVVHFLQPTHWMPRPDPPEAT